MLTRKLAIHFYILTSSNLSYTSGMSNQDTFNAFLSIMVNNINHNGKCNDSDLCIEIAHYINMLPKTVYWLTSLYDFIYEYGENVIEIYLGRDEEGEKMYYVENPKTNWNERIREELVKLGYYKRVS